MNTPPKDCSWMVIPVSYHLNYDYQVNESLTWMMRLIDVVSGDNGLTEVTIGY